MTDSVRDQWAGDGDRPKESSDPEVASIFEVESLERFMKSIDDPYFHDVILGDDLKFKDISEAASAAPMGTTRWRKEMVVDREAYVDTVHSERLLREKNASRDGSA